MPQKLQPVRGTHDILPDEMRLRRHITDTAREVAQLYGFQEVSTPIFEFTDVFHRTLGDTSDVVTKETYTFEDRGGESLTLRPEFTAACVRAFLSGGLTQSLPVKWFYHGPAFRYERPQKGRLRQFHQFGIELLGNPDPTADVEVIACAAQIIRALVSSSGREQGEGAITLQLNSLGDTDSRHAYRTALVEYLTTHKATLSEDSVTRLERNPLRILDSKDAGDREVVANAPALQEYFTQEAQAFYASVQEGLTALEIPFTLNPKLVRGLDYYSHTVFEFVTDQLGAQGTLLAGGRYDGLVELMGGPPTPGIGFAAGIERIAALLEAAAIALPEPTPPVAVIAMDSSLQTPALTLSQQLRAEGIAVETYLRGNIGKLLKKADKLGCSHAIILGTEEWSRGEVVVKDLTKGEQVYEKKENIIKYFQ